MTADDILNDFGLLILLAVVVSAAAVIDYMIRRKK